MVSKIDSRSFFERYFCCCCKEPQEIPKGMRAIKVTVEPIFADQECTKSAGEFGLTDEANSQTQEAMKFQELRRQFQNERLVQQEE